jgi:hypothetical protein
MLVRSLMLVLLACPVFGCGGSSTSESSDGVDPSNLATSAAALNATSPVGSTTVPPPAGCGTPIVNAAGAAVSVSDSQTGTGLEAFTVEACATPDGVHWTGPTALGQGANAAAAIAANGRAVIVWQGGPATAPNVQASAMAPGGSFSAPVTVSSDPGHPAVAIDGTGNAVAIWAPLNLDSAVQTASLPAGGDWTSPQTLDAHGGGVAVAANPAGDAVVTWRERTTNEIEVASGTILGGFGAPVPLAVDIEHAVEPGAAGVNAAGEAVVAWESNDGVFAAARNAAGNWGAPAQLSTAPSTVAVTSDASGTLVVSWTGSAGTAEATALQD